MLRGADDPIALARLYNAYAVALGQAGRLARALEYCEAGLRLVQQTDNEQLRFAIELRLALIHSYAGDAIAFRRAIDAANAHSLAVMDAASPMFGYYVPAYMVANLGFAARLEGDFETASRLIGEGVQRARLGEIAERVDTPLSRSLAALSL